MDKPNQTDPSAIFDSSEQLAAQENSIADNLNQARENQLGSTDESNADGGSSSDANTQEDSSKTQTNPDADVLKFAESSTGRKFTSVEDFQKYLKNLNSLVGDQEVAKARENSKKFNELVEKLAAQNGQTAENVDKMVELLAQTKSTETQKPEQPKDDKYGKLSSDLEKLQAQLNRNELLSKHPYAKDVQDEVSIIARQKGITDLEAFEASPFKTLLETKAKEESAKSPVVTSSNRIGVDRNKIADKASKVLKSDSDEDKLDLVKAMGAAVGL